MEPFNLPLVIALIVIVGAVLILWTYFKRKEEQFKAEQFAELIRDANRYVDDIKAQRRVPTITDASLMLTNDENVFLQETTILRETRSVRHNKGAGASVRIMKGVSLRTYAGDAESTKEWRLLDTGSLCLTNHKLVFRGKKENRVMKLEHIMSIEPWRDAIMISSDTRTAPMLFDVANPFIWSAAIHILRTAKDPLSLGDMNIDISFQAP